MAGVWLLVLFRWAVNVSSLSSLSSIPPLCISHSTLSHTFFDGPSRALSASSSHVMIVQLTLAYALVLLVLQQPQRKWNRHAFSFASESNVSDFHCVTALCVCCECARALRVAEIQASIESSHPLFHHHHQQQSNRMQWSETKIIDFVGNILFLNTWVVYFDSFGRIGRTTQLLYGHRYVLLRALAGAQPVRCICVRNNRDIFGLDR